MAKREGKKGIKKSARMAKGKALQAVKPLKESVTLNFGGPVIKYTPQK